MLMDFGLPEVPADRTGCIQKLQEFLVSRRSQGRLPVLVVDEAHKLDLAVLEELRLITNFEDATGKLLQVVLAGQNELDVTLKREELRQFKQRVAHRFSILALTNQEVSQYIRHRWVRAGATRPEPFTEEAVLQVALSSRGIPRVINTLCDNALLLGFASGIARIGPEHIQEVAADLDIATDYGVPGRESDPPAPASTKSASQRAEASLEETSKPRPRRNWLLGALFGRGKEQLGLRLHEDRP
jgi:general secretion pathway protein A